MNATVLINAMNAKQNAPNAYFNGTQLPILRITLSFFYAMHAVLMDTNDSRDRKVDEKSCQSNRDDLLFLDLVTIQPLSKIDAVAGADWSALLTHFVHGAPPARSLH